MHRYSLCCSNCMCEMQLIAVAIAGYYRRCSEYGGRHVDGAMSQRLHRVQRM